MKHNFCRPLNNDRFVNDFLRIVLDHKVDYTTRAIQQLIGKIVDNEMALQNLDNSQSTFNSLDYRVEEFKSPKDRKYLQEMIASELHEFKRLKNDNDIKLGKGGAKPLTPVKNKKQAIIIIGLPASGKSSIATKIADYYGAYILDSDFAKRKLPEFHTHRWGASLVHEESDFIVNDPFEQIKFKSLFVQCYTKGTNIVLPKIGAEIGPFVEFLNAFKNEYGYSLHLVLVNLDRRDATIRALKRFAETERYIPLAQIFDGYANNPSLNYYLLKNYYKHLFSSFGAIDSKEVTINYKKRKVLECDKNSPVKLFL